MKRRKFLKLAGAGAIGGLGWYYWPDEGFLNPCLGNTPKALLEHDMVLRAWDGLDASQVWDVHTHLIGNGDSGSGIRLNPAMLEWSSPAHSVRYNFYINASCSNLKQGIDLGYVDRLVKLQSEFPEGAKSMLLAFDAYHNLDGIAEYDKTSFYVPNKYVHTVSQTYSDRFEWTASIHPYRDDAISQLDNAVKNGARCVKWLPAVMGMDPFSEKCDDFYQALIRHNIPLITHAGNEYAVAGVQHQEYGNPLRLRRALDQGVKVIVAHCANEGNGTDFESKSHNKKLSNFKLFVRLMDDKQYENNLFADISAMTQINHVGPPLIQIIQRDDWHHRLLNGSDYPLPGVMPLFSTKLMHDKHYITESEAGILEQLRQYNPLLYDFVLKRSLRVGTQRLSDSVFMTRKHFEKHS